MIALEHQEKMIQIRKNKIKQYQKSLNEIIYLKEHPFEKQKIDTECMNVPIFKYYDSFQIFQRISCASNEDIVTIKEKLLNREELYHDKIEPEIKSIKQLKQIMDDYTSAKDNSIKIVMLKDFSKALGIIIDKHKKF